MEKRKENNSSVLTFEEKESIIENIEGTPFTMVGKENELRIVIGNQIVTNKTYDSKECVLAEIEKINWELVINSTCMIVEGMLNEKNSKGGISND